MKKLLAVVALTVSLTVITGLSSQAFNSATHIYIAEQVFASCSDKIDLDYGSIAPDLALYVANQGKWPTAFDDTHHNYIDFRSYTGSSIQTAFAKGWLTHNEVWGADYYAHLYPFNGGKSYVETKAEALGLGALDPTGEFAHFAVEVAIDLLLKQDNHELGQKLLKANLLRSWQDPLLLTRVLVLRERVTNQLTLTSAELAFRSLVGQYAPALALPSPMDKIAIVGLGVQLAKQQYGIDVTAEHLNTILNLAISLCETDYSEVIQKAVSKIKAGG